ncbi:Nuclear envelope pore membrane protein POM 121C, partial [Tauraco erythrolophus]
SLEQLVSPVASPADSRPDPCARETVLSAISKSRKRAVEQQEEEEEDQAFGNDQESKRRTCGQSDGELIISSLTSSRPGSLKRSLVSHCPDDCSNKRSRTSSISSLNNTYTAGIPSSSHNVISSSYSSSCGLSQLRKRSGVSVSSLSSPASSRSQTPERPLKKAREEELHRSNTSTPAKSDKELQTEKAVETPVRKRRNSPSPQSTSQSSGTRRRKIQLLTPNLAEPLALPPPPQLGYSITAEDLDAEKKAAWQWINKFLEDKTDAVPSTTAETTPVSSPLAFAVTSPAPVPTSTAPVPASTNLLLDSLKKMQSSQAVPVPADSTGAAVASQPPSSAAQLPAPARGSFPLPPPSAAPKPVPVLSTPAPTAPLALGAQTPNSLASPAFTELGQTPSKPPSFPKPSILFGMLNTPPASQLATTTTAAVPTTTAAVPTATTAGPTTTPVFKPIFGALPKSESTAPCTAVVSASVTVPASSGPSSTTSQPFLFSGPASSAPSTETSFATPGPVFQFGKPPPATVTATTSVPGGPAFGQAPSNLTAPTTTVGFSIFGGTALTSSTPATTGHVTLTFGSSGSAKPAAGPVSFGPPFSFGAPAAQSAAQPAFGSGAQPAFGTASAQGSFGTSSTQAAFGTTTSIFSFGTATSTTAGFGSTTQTPTSSTGTAVFGTTPSPFTFGASAQPGPSASAFGIGTPALGSGSPAVAFSFGAGQSTAAPAAAPFGSSLTQSALGAQNQSTPFAFTVPSTPDNKPVFGGTPAPAFGQSTPVPGAVGSGSSSLSFGTPSTPASGFGGVGASFGSSTPAFSIGAGSKTGARQRL